MKTYIFKNKITGDIQPIEAKNYESATKLLPNNKWQHGHDNKSGYWLNTIKQK